LNFLAIEELLGLLKDFSGWINERLGTFSQCVELSNLAPMRTPGLVIFEYSGSLSNISILVPKMSQFVLKGAGQVTFGWFLFGLAKLFLAPELRCHNNELFHFTSLWI